MVTKGLPETMTGNFSDDPHSSGSAFDDAPSLDTADRGFLASAIGKDKAAPTMGVIESKGLKDLFVEGDGLGLARFMLCDGQMSLEAPSIFIINLVPAQPKQIADPEGRASRHDN